MEEAVKPKIRVTNTKALCSKPSIEIKKHMDSHLARTVTMLLQNPLISSLFHRSYASNFLFFICM